VIKLDGRVKPGHDEFNNKRPVSLAAF